MKEIYANKATDETSELDQIVEKRAETHEAALLRGQGTKQRKGKSVTECLNTLAGINWKDKRSTRQKGQLEIECLLTLIPKKGIS